MKAIKYIGNAYVFIGLYLLLLIEGEHLGGFYILYILLGLPHGALYAVISTAGIMSLVLGYNLVKYQLRVLLIPAGIILMGAGLYTLFSEGKETETFNLTLPLISFILCCLSCTCLIFNYFNSIISSRRIN